MVTVKKQCGNCRFMKLSRQGKKTKSVCAYKRRGKVVKASGYCPDWSVNFKVYYK